MIAVMTPFGHQLVEIFPGMYDLQWNSNLSGEAMLGFGILFFLDRANEGLQRRQR